MYPKRGEVWWVSFDAPMGGEIQKTRPAIVISNDSANAALNRIIVVPMTSKVTKIYPSEALVNLNGQQRKAMADQIIAVSKLRLKNRLGVISKADLAAVEDVILLQLGIR